MMGSPVASPPLYPGCGIGVQILPGQAQCIHCHSRGPGTGNTNCEDLLLNLFANKTIEVNATWCISTGRPLEGETIILSG